MSFASCPTNIRRKDCTRGGDSRYTRHAFTVYNNRQLRYTISKSSTRYAARRKIVQQESIELSENELPLPCIREGSRLYHVVTSTVQGKPALQRWLTRPRDRTEHRKSRYPWLFERRCSLSRDTRRPHCCDLRSGKEHFTNRNGRFSRPQQETCRLRSQLVTALQYTGVRQLRVSCSVSAVLPLSSYHIKNSVPVLAYT